MEEPQAKILVVDDEVKNVKLLEALLVPRGYRVVKAYNGEEALQQVHQEEPDLILLDVMNPTAGNQLVIFEDQTCRDQEMACAIIS